MPAEGAIEIYRPRLLPSPVGGQKWVRSMGASRFVFFGLDPKLGSFGKSASIASTAASGRGE